MCRMVQSSAVPAQPVHIIGVSLDLGGNRRGVDMGPSAFRIAGLAERLTALGVTGRRRGRSRRADPGSQGVRRSEEEVHPRDRARLRAALQDVARRRSRRAASRSCSAATTASPPGSVAATADFVRRDGQAARPHLGRRARRHEHAGELRQRQRARHAAGGAARPGARGAVAHRRLLAEGRGRAHRAHRHPQPRRAREGDRRAPRACTSSR